MIRGRVHSYKGQVNRVWFYGIYDDERPIGRQNLIGGVRLTHRGAIVAVCTWLKYRSERNR